MIFKNFLCKFNYIREKGNGFNIEIAQREASIIPNVLDHYLENNSLFIERDQDNTICFVSSYKNDMKWRNDGVYEEETK